MDTPLPTTGSEENLGVEGRSSVEGEEQQYNRTLFEACEELNKSRKTVSRYVRRGLLHPIRVRSQQGTLEYRFSQQDLEAFKSGQPRQDSQDARDGTGQRVQNSGAPLLKTKIDETGRQATDLTDETGTLAKAMNSSLARRKQEKTRQDTRDETGQSAIAHVLEKTITTLTGQLATKDDQIAAKDKQIGGLHDTIKHLAQKNSDFAALLGMAHERIMRLPPPRKRSTSKTRPSAPVVVTSDETASSAIVPGGEPKPVTNSGKPASKSDASEGTDKTGTSPERKLGPQKKGFLNWIFEDPKQK